MLITETFNFFSYCRNPDAMTGGIWLVFFVFYDTIVWSLCYDAIQCNDNTCFWS